MHVEALEDRRMLAVFTVTNLQDGPVNAPADLPGSLRQALYDANTTPGADEIVWSPTIVGTITLSEGELSITDDLTVTGLGSDLTVIDAAGTSRVLNIIAPTVFLNSLQVTGGAADRGGGIFNDGHLTLNAVTISGNLAQDAVGNTPGGDGGGIFSLQSLTINDSTISGNRAGAGGDGGGRGGHGGAVYISGGQLAVTGSTISGNSAGGFLVTYEYSYGYIALNDHTGEGGSGGGIFSKASASAITDSIISDNRAGNGGTSDSGGDGGGIHVAAGDLTITASVVSDNGAGYGGDGYSFLGHYGGSGGGIASTGGGHLSIMGSSLLRNTAGQGDYFSGAYGAGGGDGGAIFASSGMVTIDDSVILENRAGDAAGPFPGDGSAGYPGGSGGGIHSDAPLTITGSTVASNVAGVTGGTTFDARGFGGGIHARDQLTVLDSTVTNNRAPGGLFFFDQSFARCFGGDGGGIHHSNSGMLTIMNSVINSNTSGGGGGGVLASNVSVLGSDISNNVSTYDGGGLDVTYRGSVLSSVISNNRTSPCYTYGYNDLDAGSGGGIATRGNVTITQSTISGNSVGTGGKGGGIYIRGGGPAVTLQHNTVANNAGEGAGGIYGVPGAFLFTLENSILATNHGPTPDLQLSPGPMTIRYSLIGTNIGSGLIEAPIGSPDADGNLIGGPIYGAIDPRLGPLTDNGGLSFTHGLLPGSPAIDAGDRNAIAGTGNVPFYDQRGEPFGRVVDGDAFPDASIDMGSFELQMATIVVDTTIDEDDGDFSIGDLSLREAVDIAETKGGSVFFDTEGIFAAPQTITLSLGELVVASAISIFGTGSSHLTIDGNHQSRLFATDDSETISRDIRLSGMTLVNGQDTSGGAIFNRENLTLEDVVISSSTASVDGGGIDHATGMLKVIDSILSGNSAAELGGAISTATGLLELSRTTIADNDSMRGGGIASRNNAYVTFDLSVITGNSATETGGGVDQRSGSSLTVLRSTIGSNGAGNGGGGIYAADGLVEVTASTISDNTSTTKASHGGGGVAMVTGTVLITSSTISGNVETRIAGTDNAGGGGIGNTSGTLIIRHSTIANNSITSSSGESPATGGGISGPATLDHTIVADNFAQDGGHDLSGEFDARYSLIENTAGALIIDNGGLILEFDPQLGPLQDNGGPTHTHVPLGRRTYNVGDPGAIAGLDDVPLHDQRGPGFDRIKVGRIDIGAVEIDELPPPACDFDEDGICNIQDLDGLISALAAGINDATYDVTGEGVLNIADRNQWLVDAGQLNLPSGNPYLLGDANLDGSVDGQDFIAWNAHKFTATGTWSQGDFNADGQTDGQDFVIWNMFKFQENDDEDSAPGRISVEVHQPWEVRQ